jgi:septum formation protein
MSHPTTTRIILASSSPRRHELLAKAGLVFEVIPSPAEEIRDATMHPGALCETNARLKAAAVACHHPGAWVIGADTLVFLGGHPIGKPADHREAATMLAALSGRTHEVRTGVCIVDPSGREHTFHETSRVTFLSLDADAIREYHALVNPLDKAGAYGAQEHCDRIIERIDGPFDNVMGLPVAPVLRTLKTERGL